MFVRLPKLVKKEIVGRNCLEIFEKGFCLLVVVNNFTVFKCFYYLFLLEVDTLVPQCGDPEWFILDAKKILDPNLVLYKSKGKR